MFGLKMQTSNLFFLRLKCPKLRPNSDLNRTLKSLCNKKVEEKEKNTYMDESFTTPHFLRK